MHLPGLAALVRMETWLQPAGSSIGFEERAGGGDQGVCSSAGSGRSPPVHAQVPGTAARSRYEV